MEYNKKNIRDADKQGIFDSSFDSRVLEMDGEEKKELSRKLQESTSSVPEDDIALSSSEEEPEKDALSRLSVWERILFFLQKIFMGATEKSYLKKIELKKVAAIVRHYRPSCYAVNSGRLSSQFGEQLYKLASQLAGFKRIYDSCREHPGHQGSNLPSFFEYFVKAFSEDMVNLENKFSYSYISKNKGLFSGQKLSETIDKEINSILSTITMDQRRQMNVLFSNLIGFERLAEFNFYLLLRKFGNNFSSLSEGYPQFEEVSGRDVLNELRKLEDLLYSIDFSVDMNTPFEILLRFYSTLLEEEERQDEAGKSWKSEDFRVLVDMMQGFLKEEKLVNLVRLIASIPFHKPHVRRHSANVIEMFRQAVQKRQIGRCQSLAYQAEMDELNLKIKELFGGASLSDIEFYNDSTNRRLTELGLPVFTNCRYLQIIKTYFERLFIPLIKPALNIVVVDGDFFDKQLYGRLSDYFYKFPDVYQGIIEFEKKISANGKEGEKIQNLFKRYSGDIPTQKVVTEKIHYLNHLSAKAIREVAIIIQSANQPLEAIVTDSIGKAKPDFVLNIKQLGGSRNRAILKAVQKASEATSLVHSIIRDFLK